MTACIYHSEFDRERCAFEHHGKCYRHRMELDHMPHGAEIVKEQNVRRARELGLPPVRGDV